MIARKSALIIATHISNAIFGYVTLFFISTYMSPWDYGVVGFAFGFVALFNIFGDLGFNSAHVKRISEGRKLSECIGTFFVTKLGLIGFMTLIFIVSIFLWKYVIGRGFESSIHETAIFIMFGYIVLSIASNVFLSTYKATKEIAKSQIPLFLEVIGRTIATIFVAVNNYGAIALVFTYIIGGFFRLFSSIILFHGYKISRPTKSCFNDYTIFAIPMILVFTCTTIMTNIDKVLIQLFWSSTDVGYYFAALRLCNFINMFTLAIGILLFPTYSNLHTNNDLEGIKQLTYNAEKYLSMIVFPMVFGMIVLAEPSVFILLSGWMPAVPILQILPIFVLLAALERPYQSQFLGMGLPSIARNRVIIMVIVNIFLNLLLIPKDIKSLGLNMAGLGTIGAAIATIASYGIGLIYSRIMVWKISKISGNTRIILHAFASFLMSIILYWLKITYPVSRWYQLISYGIIGFAIYISILYILKEFNKQDFHFFYDTINIKKMLIYIKQEIKRK